MRQYYYLRNGQEYLVITTPTTKEVWKHTGGNLRWQPTKTYTCCSRRLAYKVFNPPKSYIIG